MKQSIIFSLIIALFATIGVGCIEDGFTNSPSDQPTFSCDTLRLGTVYTLDGTPTKRFTVYNRHSKMLNISSISMRDDDSRLFRLNVDGVSGRSFSNVEIRPNDSIFVFVEATLPENGTAEEVDFNRHLDFVTNGVTSTVVFNIAGQDVVRQKGLKITENTIWTAGRPYLIYDTLHIAEGATLTIEQGARLRFHDKAGILVDGTLIARGTPEQPVEMTGDRDGFVAAEIPYELMSGQWDGITFTDRSRANRLEYTSIRNSVYGLVLDSVPSVGAPALTMINSQVRNSANFIIASRHSDMELVGCDLTDAASGILLLIGGNHTVNHCTIANYYLFSALGGPAIQFAHIDADSNDGTDLPLMSADFTNTIIYGNGTELSHGDLTGTDIFFRRCLLKSAGTDDDNFIECLWDTDPLYYTVRSEYIFDYRLQPDSPAIGAAYKAYDIFDVDTDRYGLPRGDAPDLGAYTFAAPAE